MLLNTNEQQELDQLQQDGHPDDKNNQQLNNDLDVDDNLNNNNSNTPSELNEQNMGKSFTIAAILGLKNKVTLNSDDSGETGIGCGGLSGVPGHELHDVMNLSINQNNIGHNKYLNNYDSDSSNNNNNNNSNNNNHNRLITNRLSSLQHFHQTNFNYHSHHPHHHQQQQQPQQQQQQPSQQQPQINNNTSAINASSALQSLQQLHHQHSHTINTVAGGFHLREKNKNGKIFLFIATIIRKHHFKKRIWSGANLVFEYTKLHMVKTKIDPANLKNMLDFIVNIKHNLYSQFA